MTPNEVLSKYWGYDGFRPLQLDIIQSILNGHDTLGLMPTGGGKSLTFQVPALMLGGLTIVITPLISLMKDQVDNLKKRNIKASMLFSGMSARERNLTFDKARLGKIKLLYVSPERLRSQSFITELRSWKVSLIVVDEAHCISQWGYDFRPSYLRIGSLREILPDVPMLALTASATPVVQKDIIENLHFGDGYSTFARSFHRENLSYVVRYDKDKESKLISALKSVHGSAIVYVRSRKATAEYAEALNREGISATFYHAGLEPKVKEERQQAWKENSVRVIVATNAFGMGIDKPDVRVVVHMDVPPSLEEYYQEAGRAGRDGLHSYALMIASPHDKATLTRRLNAAFPPRDYILNVYDKACVFMDIPVGEGYNHIYEFNVDKFCKIFRLDPDAVRGALTILSNSGYFDYNDDPTTRARVMITLPRDEFYGLTLEHSEQEVINMLMRLYPGLFADYVNIDEEAVATNARMSREDVYQNLLSLKRKNIIDYVPKRELPYIYLPTSRELSKYITIPRSVYEDRRKLMEQRVNAIRNFVFGGDKCRDRVLLEYFGESDVCDCGVCDICIDRRRRPVDMTSFIIDSVMLNPGISITNLMQMLPGQENQVTEMLRALIKQKRILRRGDSLWSAAF